VVTTNIPLENEIIQALSNRDKVEVSRRSNNHSRRRRRMRRRRNNRRRRRRRRRRSIQILTPTLKVTS